MDRLFPDPADESFFGIESLRFHKRAIYRKDEKPDFALDDMP
jgi:hypothetical protein